MKAFIISGNRQKKIHTWKNKNKIKKERIVPRRKEDEQKKRKRNHEKKVKTLLLETGVTDIFHTCPRMSGLQKFDVEPYRMTNRVRESFF